MKKQLKDFVQSHPEGWGHGEWLGLLTRLGNEGVDVSDADAVGLALERTRLEWELGRRSVKGLGPKRSVALVDHFETLWKLRQASVDDIAGVPSLNRDLAEKVFQVLQ
jgi:hypothetical protein